MLLAISRLIRYAALIGMALTVVAIGLGRMTPPREARELGGPGVVFVSSYLLRTPISRLNLLDVERGNLNGLNIDTGDGLDCFSAAPWTDAWGESHLAGRWSSTVGQAEDTLFHGFGLARVAYPSGRLVDRVETDVQPCSPPCWFPGTAARILFPAGDGLLYSYSFEDQPGAPSLPDRLQPRPLRWELPGHNAPPGIVQDLAWAAPLGTTRMLVATILPRDRPTGLESLAKPELWWFRLAEDGSAVVAGGRLLAPGAGASPWTSFRKATIATASDGGRLLACLADSPEGGLSLAVMPLVVDPATEGLLVDLSDAQLVAEHCLPVAPAFSADGRWISFAQKGFPEDSLRVGRAAVPPSVRRLPGASTVASVDR